MANFNSKGGTYRWQKGQAPYAEWLKTLTPEEYKAHIVQRKVNKSIKAATAAVNNQYKAEWTTALINAAIAVLSKAQTTGDPAAFVAVWDRINGKPESSVDVTSQGSHIDPMSRKLAGIEDTDMIEILTNNLREDINKITNDDPDAGTTA